MCGARDVDRQPAGRKPSFVPRPDDDTVYTQPQLAIDQTGPLALSAFAHRRGFVDVVVFLANPGTDRFGPPR